MLQHRLLRFTRFKRPLVGRYSQHNVAYGLLNMVELFQQPKSLGVNHMLGHCREMSVTKCSKVVLKSTPITSQ